jgi:hypothetical protein
LDQGIEKATPHKEDIMIFKRHLYNVVLCLLLRKVGDFNDMINGWLQNFELAFALLLDVYKV